MILGFLHGANIKRLSLTIVAVFAYIFITDWLFHGMYMESRYLETATLWRAKEEMEKTFGWMLLGQFLIASFFSMIFVVGYQGKGVMEGVRFGVLIGMFVVGSLAVSYAVTPYPCSIICNWIWFTVVQAVGGGIVASVVYKK